METCQSVSSSSHQIHRRLIIRCCIQDHNNNNYDIQKVKESSLESQMFVSCRDEDEWKTGDAYPLPLRFLQPRQSVISPDLHRVSPAHNVRLFVLVAGRKSLRKKHSRASFHPARAPLSDYIIIRLSYAPSFLSRLSLCRAPIQ